MEFAEFTKALATAEKVGESEDILICWPVGNHTMFTRKKRQISTWELALMAAFCVAGIVGGGTPGLIIVIALIAIVGVYLIWTRL